VGEVRRYRVVQWATGNIGAKSLRGVIDHPQLDLVGVYVHSRAKVGLDAGELSGLGTTTGVVATTDIEEIVRLGADCVLYMAQRLDVDEICRLLESGANVVTTRGEFHRPESMDPALRSRTEAACARGRSSIHSTGSSPGFVTEALPLVLTTLQRRLDGLSISEFADLSRRPSPALLFDTMGFGKERFQFDQARLQHARIGFGPSLMLLADALGVQVDSLEAHGEVAVANRTVEIAAGSVQAGTVAAQRLGVSAMRAGRAVITFVANWYCSTDLEAGWDLRPTGWRVDVDGDAPLRVDLTFPVPLERYAETMPGYTANRAVNVVPFVCDAPPGIRTSLDLPQIVAVL
jgi:4-hydroxy-tetrahydrodipicolinate reductase